MNTNDTPRAHLAIFGATSGVGRELLRLATAAGHPCTVLARDPSKLEGLPLENARVVQGDVFDPAAVADALTDADAVMVALGAPALSKSKVRSAGTQRIVEAMEARGLSRLVVVSVYGILETEETLPFFLRYVIFPTYLRRPAQEHTRQEEILRASSLDWTAIRPPTLTDGPRTGEYAHGDLSGEGLTLKISRSDVADFMLRQLESEAYLRRSPAISYAS